MKYRWHKILELAHNGKLVLIYNPESMILISGDYYHNTVLISPRFTSETDVLSNILMLIDVFVRLTFRIYFEFFRNAIVHLIILPIQSVSVFIVPNQLHK